MRSLVSLLIVVLCAGALRANDPPVPSHKDDALRINFPVSLAGMEYVGFRSYDEPEFGYSVRYEGSEFVKADLYVYDGGIKDIQNGWDNDLVKAEAASVFEGLKTLEQRGDYTGVTNISSGLRPEQRPIQFVWNSYQFSHPARGDSDDVGPRLSEGFVTGFGGKFIKVRLTYKRENSQEGGRTSLRMINEIVHLLQAASTPKEGEKLTFTVETDGTLPAQTGAAWLGYILARTAYIGDHEDQYALLVGVVPPLFEDELHGRSSLAQIWKELKEKEENLKDVYIDELELVHGAGFMREYVWTYLRRPSWKEPDTLRLKEFDNWRSRNLKNHRAETHGRIRGKIAPREAKPEDKK